MDNTEASIPAGNVLRKSPRRGKSMDDAKFMRALEPSPQHRNRSSPRRNLSAGPGNRPSALTVRFKATRQTDFDRLNEKKSPRHQDRRSKQNASLPFTDSDSRLGESKSSFFSDQFNMSQETLQMSNMAKGQQQQPPKSPKDMKTAQIIESLVWFSFHIPRTVLEDLIAHELELWERTRGKRYQQKRRGGRRNHVNVKDDEIACSVPGDDEASDFLLGSVMSPEKYNGIPGKFRKDMMHLPKNVPRESAILFVDMSGFTKLATMLDVESLSKVINTYFDMILSELIQFGADVLKFAGDAIFCEWRVVDELSERDGDSTTNILSDMNASMLMGDLKWEEDEIPPLASRVMQAAKCATSLVKKFSDYQVTTGRDTTDAMLNLHCGLGAGHLVGLHIGDYQEGQDVEDNFELRREFLVMGSPIDQVSKAADMAKHGEVYASPEAMKILECCCDLTEEQESSTEPVCIAVREKSYLKFKLKHAPQLTSGLQPYESLRMHCKSLNHAALGRLHAQMALYVHPVIRSDELVLSAAIQEGAILQPTETIESRHRAQAELRSVYTMFISPLIKPKVTGRKEIDEKLCNTLHNIMRVTSRELDRYSGHLRQFIVDDKGIVLIATFGLRGSTFPNMVENNCLPATFAVYNSLKSELKVDSRIGATFGKVYCGVVGGVRRHEFAVMGPAVNLAARLMSSTVNNGILVDEAVQEQCRGRYVFKSLPPVKAKGYDKPVRILEPSDDTSGSAQKNKKNTVGFVGRAKEKWTILAIANNILDQVETNQNSIVFLTGESGMGKSALVSHVFEELKVKCKSENILATFAKSTSTETDQRIPLSTCRKVLLSVIRDRCLHDDDETKTHSSSVAIPIKGGRKLRSSMHSNERRAKLLASKIGIDDTSSDDTESPLVTKITRRLKNESVPLEDDGSVVKHFRGKGLQNHAIRHPTSLNQTVHSEYNSGSSHKSRNLDSLSHSLHRVAKHQDQAQSLKSKSLRMMHFPKPTVRSQRFMKDDSSRGSADWSTLKQASSVVYFEKLCWACEKLNYPFEYADIVGSQFLGFECATPITHINGHVPTMDELVEFLALVFLCMVDHAKLQAVFLDDFQGIDSFSWKVFRVISKKADNILLICASRSHDKQAQRRMTSVSHPDDHFRSQMIELSLGPFDMNEIRELISIVLEQSKEAISADLCADIFARSGGLPVYTVQVLENIKRTGTLCLVNGTLEWTKEGLQQKRHFAASNSGAVMEETFLSRFDALDVRVRKILQTCAVLGQSFELADVACVHVEIAEQEIENALNSAVDEMILVEQIDEDRHREGVSLNTDPHDFDTSLGDLQPVQRYFQFSHAMWRKNVLSTMLKERKAELHRLVALSMEKDQSLIPEESDISRLLKLFEHWKSCGDFCKAAPLALAIGARLEEWDLSDQSLELYEDALETAFSSVEETDQVSSSGNKEFVQVKARPLVLDLILRLHICIGLCHQRLGQEQESIYFFEDAFHIIQTSSKMVGICKSLRMPIISSLCVLRLETEYKEPDDIQILESLIGEFVREAEEEGTPIHIGRSLAMQASYYARMGHFEDALEWMTQLTIAYNIEQNSADMIAEYGRDFAIECLSESIHWLYLLGLRSEAEKRASIIIKKYLSLLDPCDTDSVLRVLFPIIQVYGLLDRGRDAEELLQTHIIKPFHDQEVLSDLWSPLFNPLVYLLDVIIMEESGTVDKTVLEDLKNWVLEENHDVHEMEIERKNRTVLGELCWRLLKLVGERDTENEALVQKAREFLEPVANGEHSELFQKRTAQAILAAL